MIDYAYPTMMAEKALKDLHNAMLKKDYNKARECAALAQRHVYLIDTAIEFMSEKDELLQLRYR